MLFMIAGHLKPGAEKRLIDFSGEFSEHLAQPFRDIVLAGALRDGEGRRKGYMAFIEADSIDDAERYLRESPYYLEGLYERCEVFRYDVQVGRLEPEGQGVNPLKTGPASETGAR